MHIKATVLPQHKLSILERERVNFKDSDIRNNNLKGNNLAMHIKSNYDKSMFNYKVVYKLLCVCIF